MVDPDEGVVSEDEFIDAEASEAEYIAGVADGEISSLSDDHKAELRAQAESDQRAAERQNNPEA